MKVLSVGERFRVLGAPYPFSTYTYEVTESDDGHVELKIVDSGEKRRSEEKEAQAAPTWVQKMYALTTRYHTETGRKVVIADLLDAFFVGNLKDVPPDDQASFERTLVRRLEQQGDFTA